MVKAFMQTAVVLLLGAALAGCTNTEVKMRHENPLDRIFDSGPSRSYRRRKSLWQYIAYLVECVPFD